jgi:hypothetical protein
MTPEVEYCSHGPAPPRGGSRRRQRGESLLKKSQNARSASVLDAMYFIDRVRECGNVRKDRAVAVPASLLYSCSSTRDALWR